MGSKQFLNDGDTNKTRHFVRDFVILLANTGIRFGEMRRTKWKNVKVVRGKDKKDTILSGIAKRLEFGNVIVDLGRTEAIIQKNEMIPRENIKAGDRVKAYC